MTRHKSAKTERTPKQKAKPAPSREPAGMPADFRSGLAVFCLLELLIYVTLIRVKEPWFTQPAMAAWRNGFLATTAVILVAVALLWRAGLRGGRFGLNLALAVLWLACVAGRLVPEFMIGGSSVPVLMTLFVGQLAFGLMVPAASNERRKEAPNHAG